MLLDVDCDIAIRSGALRPQTRRGGLSLGDRICVATAERHGLPIMTGDRSWILVALDVEIILIR